MFKPLHRFSLQAKDPNDIVHHWSLDTSGVAAKSTDSGTKALRTLKVAAEWSSYM